MEPTLAIVEKIPTICSSSPFITFLFALLHSFPTLYVHRTEVRDGWLAQDMKHMIFITSNHQPLLLVPLQSLQVSFIVV